MTETAKDALNHEVLAHGIDFNKIKTHGLYIAESGSTLILTKRYEELLNSEQALDIAVEALKELEQQAVPRKAAIASKALAEILSITEIEER